MLRIELMVVLCDNCKEHTNRLCRKNSEFIVIKLAGRIINTEI